MVLLLELFPMLLLLMLVLLMDETNKSLCLLFCFRFDMDDFIDDETSVVLLSIITSVVLPLKDEDDESMPFIMPILELPIRLPIPMPFFLPIPIPLGKGMHSVKLPNMLLLLLDIELFIDDESVELLLFPIFFLVYPRLRGSWRSMIVVVVSSIA